MKAHEARRQSELKAIKLAAEEIRLAAEKVEKERLEEIATRTRYKQEFKDDILRGIKFYIDRGKTETTRTIVSGAKTADESQTEWNEFHFKQEILDVMGEFIADGYDCEIKTVMTEHYTWTEQEGTSETPYYRYATVMITKW